MHSIIILGAGQIGTAAKVIIDSLQNQSNFGSTDIVPVHLWDMEQKPEVTKVLNFNTLKPTELAAELQSTVGLNGKGIVVNALPFSLNEKVAQGAFAANCSYIDFTEDDIMASKVQAIYTKNTELTCAVKCGLAPGFINYVGKQLTTKIDVPEKLMICVGALPRCVSYSDKESYLNYNLTWSVDGLVNEYIRPCNVKIAGMETQVPPLTGLQNLVIDGRPFEAAFTSGGVGSLVKDLENLTDVSYKTIRYPGHYKYVLSAVQRHKWNFDLLKKEFLTLFPYTTDDMIVFYAEINGKSAAGTKRKETISGILGSIELDGKRLTAIQATTAGSGVGMLQLIIAGKLSGIINHTDVSFDEFMNTSSVKNTYVWKV